MVRILFHGGIKYTDKMVYKKLKICCGECNCVFLCEYNDLTNFVDPVKNEDGTENVILSIDCPDCEATNIIPKIGMLSPHRENEEDYTIYAYGTGVDFLSDKRYKELCDEVDKRKSK